MLFRSGGTIGIDGTVTIQFTNVVAGPIPCSIDSVSIYQQITGLDSVENPAAGSLGRAVESPQEFEYRRSISVERNTNGSLGSIYANVFAVDGVSDVICIENSTGDVLVYGASNYNLAAHSIYVGVVGGDDNAIAQAIWEKKSGTGAAMNGNTTVVVSDTSYSYPQPTYNITFNRPDDVNLKVTVQLKNSPTLPAGIVQLVKDAVISAFNGDGGQRVRIGGTVLASNFYAAIMAIGNTVFIVTVKVAKGTGSVTNDAVAFGIDENPTLDESNIVVSLV